MKKHITHILGLCLCVVVSLGGFLIGGELDSFPAFKALFATNADAAEDTASYYYDGNSVIFSGEGTVKASWFRGNRDIESVEIPVSIDYIEPYAFSGCTGLKSVRIGTGSGSGIGTTVGSYAFSNCKALESATVLSADIGDYAFQGCSNLSDITVASCGRIGNGAFYNCSKLSLGIYDIGWVESIGADAFYGTAWYNTQSYWDNGILYYGTYLIKAKTVDGQSGKCTVKDNTVLIADSAFSNSSFASVIVPDSVRSIGNNAFSGINILAYAGNATGSPWGAKKIAKYYDDTFVYSDENKTQLEGCLENKGNIVIPNGVTGIVYRAFYEYTGITSITIPESVTSIGKWAFYGCTRLTEINFNAANVEAVLDNHPFCRAGTAGEGINVTFGDSVEKIPASLFCEWFNSNYSPKIKSVIIGSNVTSIGNEAFNNCTALTSITIPDSVTSIGYRAFYGCTGLKTAGPIGGGYNIEFGWKELIPDSAFYECTGLTSITIPESVTSIGYRAFSGCTGLTSITIPESVTSIGSSAFSGCTGLKTAGPIGGGYNIEFGWKESIPDIAFSGCTDLTSIIIPDSVTSIGYRAFSGCTGLKTAGPIGRGYNYEFGWKESIPDSAFYECTGLTSITIPESVTSIGYRAFSDCTGLKTAGPIGGGYNYEFGWKGSIPECAFSDCTGLTSITIPDSVTSIGNNAFSGCTGLTSVTIGNSVTSIGNYAFSSCTGLTEINYNAANAADLTSSSTVFYNAGTAGQGINVTFGNSVEKIPAYLFYVSNSNYKPNIKTVTTGNSVISIGISAFEGCTGLTSITIPDSVTSIGVYAFEGCTGLTSITIPDSVTSIGYRAFYGCTGLTEINYNAANAADLTSSFEVFYNAGTAGEGINVTFGDSVEKIPAYLFYVNRSNYRPNIRSVTIGNSVTSIGICAFEGCTGLTSITIPDSVTSIGYDAFYGCIGLKTAGPIGGGYNIEFGWKESIPDSAFSNCTGLTSVTIPNSVISIGDLAFYGCTGLTSVTIGNSVISIGDLAFYGCTGLTSVTIGNSVTSIGIGAFSDCTGLTEINYNAANAVDLTFSFEVFSNAGTAGEGINVTFGDSVEKIPAYLFYAGVRPNIKSVTIGNSVTSIGDMAFYGCTGLTDIYYAGSESDRGEILIGYNNEELASATWHYNSSVSDSPDNPLLNLHEANIIKGNSTDNQKTYKYRTSVTFTANVPKGGKVQWYIDGKKAGTDSTLTVKDSISSYTVTVIVTDKNGNQTMDEEKVTIKNSFFDKLIWFFVHLFNPGAYDIKQ